MKRRERAARIQQILEREFPRPAIPLQHDDPFTLLVAVVLSAQCTDERVNMVTPGLFARYPDPAALAAADPAALETMIHSTGFFRQKAKSLRAVAAAVTGDFGGELPRDIDVLVTLPGVGRKTANVILGTAFGVPAIVVDTHVRRLAQRLGFTDHDEPDKIEQDLRALLPASEWTHFTHRLIHHGRRICAARKPRCADCALLAECPQIGVPPAIRPKGGARDGGKAARRR
jgi:endonuclease-3